MPWGGLDSDRRFGTVYFPALGINQRRSESPHRRAFSMRRKSMSKTIDRSDQSNQSALPNRRRRLDFAPDRLSSGQNRRFFLRADFRQPYRLRKTRQSRFAENPERSAR